jgi:hypothetical protein
MTISFSDKSAKIKNVNEFPRMAENNRAILSVMPTHGIE